jgi:hypothetical protein
MKTISMLSMAVVGGIAFAGAAFAQPNSTPNTTNPVPTDCARTATPGAKDECARANTPVNPSTNQGQLNGTGVGKGQGSGQGVGQGSGQGATQGTGTMKK